jgi:hypothetical protein
MSTSERATLAVLVVLVDAVAFVLPLSALFAAYVIVARPPWFLAWVRRLYGSA